MEFKLLTEQQRNQISLDKMLQLEAERYRLDLDIRLAEAAEIENEHVARARDQLAILDLQISTLTSWLQPPPAPEVLQPEMLPAPRENGRDAKVA